MTVQRQRQVLGFGDQVIRPESLDRLRYWRPYWRAAILRGLEKALFGGEANATAPYHWNVTIPTVASSIREAKLFTPPAIRTYSAPMLSPVDGDPVGFVESEEHVESVVQSRYSYRLSDVIVDVRTGGCWNKNGWILGESAGALSGGSISWEFRESWRRTARHSEARLLVLPVHHNYFHWLIDFLPPFINSLREAPEGTPILASLNSPTWLRERVAEIGWRVRWTSDVVIHSDEYFVTGRGRSEASPEEVALLRSALPRAQGASSDRTGVILTRKAHTRYDTATLLFEKTAQDLGGVLIDPAQMSLSEVRAAVEGACWIAAASGAALANLVWARRGTPVAIWSDPRFGSAVLGHFGPLAESLGLPLSLIRSSDSWSVDTLTTVLREVIRGLGTP